MPLSEEQPQAVLRLRHACVGGLGEPIDPARDVDRFALAAQQHHRQIELRQAVAVPRGCFVRGQRLRVVAAPIRFPADVRCLVRRRRKRRRDTG